MFQPATMILQITFASVIKILRNAWEEIINPTNFEINLADVKIKSSLLQGRNQGRLRGGKPPPPPSLSQVKDEKKDKKF